MIRVKRIKPQEVDCYGPNKGYLGHLNEYEFLDLLCQIKKEKAEGYFIYFDRREIPIENTGRVTYKPPTLFRAISNSIRFLIQ